MGAQRKTEREQEEHTQHKGGTTILAKFSTGAYIVGCERAALPNCVVATVHVSEAFNYAIVSQHTHTTTERR
jgi:hypothetical protein